MWLLAVCLSVLVLLAGFTVATVIDTRDGPDPFEPHPPDSDSERDAAALATRFADAVAREDAPAACRLAAGALAREMRCTTNVRSSATAAARSSTRRRTTTSSTFAWSSAICGWRMGA